MRARVCAHECARACAHVCAHMHVCMGRCRWRYILSPASSYWHFSKDVCELPFRTFPFRLCLTSSCTAPYPLFTHTHTLSLSLSLFTHAHTLSLSPLHSHTHTLSLDFVLSLSLCLPLLPVSCLHIFSQFDCYSPPYLFPSKKAGRYSSNGHTVLYVCIELQLYAHTLTITQTRTHTNATL